MSAPGPLAGMSHATMANVNGVTVSQPVEYPTKSWGICLKGAVMDGESFALDYRSHPTHIYNVSP